jgi:2-polyprenyl-3-methyl-5-hydroxy-6-metoxy-1,4-benzoquinol methylase
MMALRELEAQTLLDSHRSIEEDRRQELIEFFGGDVSLDIDPPDYATNLSEFDDAALFEYLEKTSKSGLIRNLLKSGRLGEAAGLVTAFTSYFGHRDRGSVRILDYGCGAGDHGLSLALAGFSVAIADVPAKVRFSAWRYERRGLKVERIEITDKNWQNPQLGRRDAVVCGEVLEHLRYPLETSRAMLSTLDPGGLLWVSAYPFREKRRGGAHLEEAFLQRQEVLKELKRNTRRIRPEGPTGYLLVKRGPGLLSRLFGRA